MTDSNTSTGSTLSTTKRADGTTSVKTTRTTDGTTAKIVKRATQPAELKPTPSPTSY